MKSKATPEQSQRRSVRGGARKPVPLPKSPKRVTKAAGGPTTRGQGTLGRLLGQVLAYFEVRTVTVREIDLVRPTDENGWLRPQIEAKLERLNHACPDHRELRRLVTLSLDLLTAVSDGRFSPGPEWREVEPRLLRALAYLVREGDAIPDDLPNGFDDDMREFQTLSERADNLFSVFEALQHGAVRKGRPHGNRSSLS